MPKWKITDLIFGKAPDENSPTEAYQSRQSSLVFSAALPAMFWTGLVGYELSQSIEHGLTLAFFILYIKIHYAAATSSDAVFDSLWERINLQSKWLDFRLTFLEQIQSPLTVRDNQTQEHQLPRAQKCWREAEAYKGQLSECWSHYPEKEPTSKASE
jgi:hypothetical protein